MKSFTPMTSFSNSRASLACLLTCIMLVAPLTPAGFASTNTSLTVQSRSKGAAQTAPKAESPAKAAPVVVQQQKDAPVTPSLVGPITASKTDNRTNAQPVGPTNTINYTIAITNTGSDAALNVLFDDPLPANTTLVPSSIQVSPLANPDSYNVIGNVRIQPDATQGLLFNDTDPDGDTLMVTAVNTAGTQGQVTFNPNGSFTFNPTAGFTGTTTFTYTVGDGTGKTDTGTVTLIVGNGTATPGSNVIWFIDASNAAAGRDGRFTNPYNSIAEFNANAADDPGDIIFVNSGTYTGPLVLTNNQQLIGRGVALVASIGFTEQPYSDDLPLAGTAPTINSAAPAGSDTVTLNAVAGANTIRGVVLGNSSDSDIDGSGFGTLTVSATTLNGTGRALNLTNGALAATFDSIGSTGTGGTPGLSLTNITGSLTVSGTTAISGATTQGINIAGSGLTANFNTTTVSAGTQGILIGTSPGNITFGNTTITGGTDGVSFQNNNAGTRTFGTLGVSGGSGNAFLHGAGGGNVTVGGAANLASTLDPINIQNPAAATINFAAGATVTKTTAGGAGILTGGTNTSTLTFNTLAVTTSNGPGVSLSGGTFNVTNAAGSSISSTGSGGQAAPAIIASGVTMSANFNTVSSTNSGTASGTGMSLTNISGTLSMLGGAISGATNTAFLVSGGTGTITYNGTITTATSNPVSVTNKPSGTINFGALITSTNNGVILNTNASTIVNFTGGLSLTTGGNAAFTAIGGGTVNATQNNSTILNTITTTTGNAVNIATGSNIGASGVTFRSINVSNGASNSAGNAIILNGTTGAFTVSGDGAQSGGFFVRNGTGGTISRTTGHSVNLTNATNVTLRQMNITNTAFGPTGAGGCPDNCVSDAVRSNGGGSIVLSAVTLQSLGGNGWRANNITGTNAINNNSRIDTWNTLTTNGVSVANTVGNNFSGSFTVDRCVFTTSATGADGFLFDVDSNGGGGTVTVTNSEFTLLDQDAVQINHDGAGILNAIVQRNNFHDADATAGTGNNTLVMALAGGGQLNFTIGGSNAADGNTFTNLGRLSANQGVLHVQAAGGAAGSSTGAKLNGTIQNNTVTNPGFVSQWRGISAIGESSGGSSGGHTISIKNNSVQNFLLQGIYVSMTTAAAGIDNLNNNINISNNQVGTTSPVGQNGGDSGSAMEFETNNGSANSGSDISANVLIQGNTAVGNNPSGIGTVLEIGNQPFGAGNSSNLNVTVLGNTLTQNNGTGETFEARNITDTSATMCLDLNSGNTSPNNSVGGTGGFKVTNDAGSYAIEGLGASTPSAHLGPKNQSNGVSPATITASGSFINSAGCTNSTAPVADPDIPVAPAAAYVAPGDTSMAGASMQAAAMTAAAKSNDITSRPFIAMPQAANSGSVAKSAANSLNANARTREIVGSNDNAAQNASPTTKAQGKNDGTVQPLVANFPVNIGTLNPGKVVTITFSVTVNNPLGAGVTQISNQGTVSGSNFSSVQTDDPDAAGTNNPTITPVIPLPTITINNATAPEPTSGSAPMPFTVVLSNAYTVPVTVNGQTADGTAKVADGDYTSTSAVVTFNAGETFQTVSVPVLADGVGGESNEDFTLTLSAPGNGTINGTGIGTGTITAVNTPGRVLISEVRTSGPNGSGDDFVELYNNQNVTQNISGWAVFKMGADCTSTPVLVGVIPAGTTVPPRGHYLIVGPQYNAANFSGTGGDPTVAAVADIESDRNLGLFNTSNLLNLSTATREDAVGFVLNAGNNCDLLREGANLTRAQGNTVSQYSFARILTTGLPKETNDAAADFQLVSTTPAVAVGDNPTPALGAPGPENLASPYQRNADIKASLVDGTVAATAPPNRVRSSFGTNATNAAFGTLSIQRRFKNTLGVSVTRLRFRIVELTTINNPPSGNADLRVLNSTGTVTPSSGMPLPTTYTGLTLEGPPQPNGGGLNSTLTVIPPNGSLAAGATIDVQFLLGVQSPGNFSFFVNVEAIPAPPGITEGTATKKGVSAKQSSSSGDAAEPKEKQ